MADEKKHDEEVDLSIPVSPLGDGPNVYDEKLDVTVTPDPANDALQVSGREYEDSVVHDNVNNKQGLAGQINLETEPYAPGGFLDPTDDLNLQATFVNNNAVAEILANITGVKLSDIINGNADLDQAAINLGNKIANFGIQSVVNIGLTTEKAISDFIDLKLTGENRWGPWRKAGEFIPEGDDLPKSVVGMITSVTGDPSTFLRKKILNEVFGHNAPGTDGNAFTIDADLNHDGYFSENERQRFAKDGALDRKLSEFNLNTPGNRYTENPAVTQQQIAKDPKILKKLFSVMEADKKMPSYRIPVTQASSRDNSFDDELRNSAFVNVGKDYNSIIPMGFDADSNDGSIFLSKGENIPKGLSDSKAYVPLSFTDMRPIGGTANATLRTIYFRPIITAFNEDFAASYNKQSYYGRSDQVVTYSDTIRNMMLSFELHAQQRSDVDVIFKKLNWLTSLVYPQYDHELLLKAGPVCRLRIGDVFSTGFKKGVTGVIDTLSFDYSDAIWELDEGNKAPRTVSVNIAFHVLHDSIIGLNNEGNFGGIGRVDQDGRYINDPEFVTTDSFRGMGNIDKKE